jgi:hypothetical protein
MELEVVGVGRIDCVSHWFETSRISNEICRPRNERTWPWKWKDSNCRIGRDEFSIVSTEMRREKCMTYDI